MDLKNLVLSLLGGTIALGPALYGLFNAVPFLAAIDSSIKRIAVTAVAFIIGVALAFLARYMGYLDIPLSTGQEAINAAWTYGVTLALSAFMSSQVIHGAVTGSASAKAKARASHVR